MESLCTPNTGYPVLGVLLYDTAISISECAWKCIGTGNDLRRRKASKRETKAIRRNAVYFAEHKRRHNVRWAYQALLSRGHQVNHLLTLPDTRQTGWHT